MGCARTRSLARTANRDPKLPPPPAADSQEIGRAPHPHSRPVQHVRVDHRRAHVAVTEQLLYRADVMPGLEQMRGEAVPPPLTARALGDAARTAPRGRRTLRHRPVPTV